VRPEAANRTAVRPLVSAIVPTRNRADSLSRALDSMYAQEERGETFDVEVIVVDDGSSDATAEVVRRYAALRYLRLPEHRGVSASRNEGLRASRGEYVSFLDDDDEWLPHKLRMQVPLLAAHPEIGVVYGQVLQRRGTDEELYPLATDARSGRVFEAMLFKRFANHLPSFLLRRGAIERAGYFDESLVTYEDYDLSLRLAFHARFLFAPGAVTIYNLSPRGAWISGAASGAAAGDLTRVVEKALRLLPDSGPCADVKREARARLALDTPSLQALAGDPGRAAAALIATLRAEPWILRYSWARQEASSIIRRCVVTAESPVAAARETCAQLETAVSGTAEAEWARGITVEVWAAAAQHLAFGSPPRFEDAMYAAGRAAAQAPSSRAHHKLLQVIRMMAVRGRKPQGAPA
jgi:GT2 family glycosyltransferase